MKKLLVVLFSFMLAGSLSAQHFRHGYGAVYAPRVIVGGGFYPYYGFGLSPFYPSPFYPDGYGYNRPSKMTMQVQDIKNDYADKIWSAKHDKALPKSERKQRVHDLKVERDYKIEDLKRNYYKH